MTSTMYLSELTGVAHRDRVLHLDAVQPAPQGSGSGGSTGGAWAAGAWTNATKRLLGLIGATSG
jgi:hypothetical protein